MIDDKWNTTQKKEVFDKIIQFSLLVTQYSIKVSWQAQY
jgi:hypothetical protein